MERQGVGPTAGELQLQVQNRLLEELRGRQEAFQTHLDLLDDVAFRLDDQGRLQMLNPAWTRLTGYPVQHCLGRLICDFVEVPEACHGLAERMQHETAIEAELTIRAQDGSLRHVVLSARRRGDWFGSIHDVTATRQALVELERSQQLSRKLSLVASRTDNLVIITDAAGCIEWVNTGFERVSGYTLEEVVGRRPGEFLQGADTQQDAVARMSRGLAEGTGFSVELINYSKDGRGYWVVIDCSPVHDADGALINFVAIQREVTSRKSAETALQASESRYRQILNTVGEAIIRCDDALVIHFANPAWLRLTGVVPGDHDRLRLTEVIHPEDRQDLLDLRARVVADGRSRKLDMRMSSRSGAWRRVELNMAVTGLNAIGVNSHLTCAISDVQARWDAEQASLRAMQKAEELSRARTSFVANMSHEIRTPLNAIVGMVSVLEHTSLTPEQRVCLQTIRNGSQTLMALVGDVLDLAKLDAGAVEVDETEFSPLEVFEDAVDMVASGLQDRGLGLRLDCGPGLPRVVRGDAMRIRQIALNLLSNAAKFTQQGRIHVRLRWIHGRAGEGWLQFAVADTGIGVPPERIASLFDAFAQADASTTRRFGGTGLGLSICRQICELLGGRIVARSAVGRGSVFSVRVPLTVADHAAASFDGSLRGVNLDAGALRIARATAEWAGLPLEVVETGGTASLLEWINSGELRNRVETGGSGSVCTPLRCWQALNGPAREPAGTPDDATLASDLRILVAEDVVPNQIVIRAMLKQLGCADVTVVDNGQQAVDWLREHCADIVLLDLHMPVKDGLTAALEVRASQGDRAPPIWAISADVTTQARQGDGESAFDGWLTKPMTRDDLAAVLHRVRSAGVDALDVAMP